MANTQADKLISLERGAPGEMEIKISPKGSLELLSQLEVSRLHDATRSGLQALFRRCSLAVLNCGNGTDDAAEIFDRYRDFDIRVVQNVRGIKLEIKNAPPSAFVDGKMIEGIKEHLFAVLRDVVFIGTEIEDAGKFDLTDSHSITNAVFHILRNARLWNRRRPPNLVVCWGGHSIGRNEYDYTKKVGYELGLRDLNVCTGCGPGAMKGPMKGATIGHSKQRIRNGRYIGISEPGIIAAESPNPIVNHLVIMPDIEKRLEAFVRTGHGVVVFPGGVGTAEEILFLLGVLLHPDNRTQKFPLVFTGPESSRSYFDQVDEFIGATLGDEARTFYKIIVDDPVTVAQTMSAGLGDVLRIRRDSGDAYYFNWLLKVDEAFQMPFDPTHENVAKLQLSADMPIHERAANLRRIFSAIVTGNVKEQGIRAVKENGPYEFEGDANLMRPLDKLLKSFVVQKRMKLASADYVPCYRVKKTA